MRRLLIVFTILQVILASCPDGFDLAQDGECKRFYMTINGIHNYEATDVAISKCQEIGALPPIIHNEEEERDWFSRWQALENSDWPVLGIVCNTWTQQWEWVDGSPVDFVPDEGVEEGGLSGNCTTGCFWSIHYTGSWIGYCDDGPGRTFDIFCGIQPSQNATEAPPVVATADNYCKCGFVDDWFDNWDPADIWVDVIIILDTSKSMGASLEEAKSVVTSFVELMTTDTNAEFYSRIGVIAMSDTVEVVYNLNMSSTDSLDTVQQHKIDKIDVGAAFQAALQMFADGSKRSSYRENAQQIIYYLTNSAPGSNMNGVEDFKTGGGIIIVNDFVLEGQVGDAGLQKLASDNFFFTDLSENYIYSLGVFCEANCFCTPDAHPYNDDQNSPRTRANRGCYHPVNNGIPQQKARETCQKERGSLVSIHNSDKEFFVSSVVSIFGPKKKYWLGLQNDGEKWNWDDKSTNPFTDWDTANGQPNTNGGKNQCAYALQGTGFNTPWTAANCAMGGVIYVCESAPCSVGYKDCA